MNFVPTTLQKELRLWLVSFLLLLPAAIPYVAHYTSIGHTLPTGFIQGDQAYYMSNAREHFDSGRFTLLYRNPFNPTDENPLIYFQPHILLLGLLLEFTQWDPGTVYVLFGFIAAWTCARIALALYKQIVGLRSSAHWIGLIAFFWGGGMLVLCGGVISGYYAYHGMPLLPINFYLKYLFQLDPSQGWWFLNFGRNLVFPTEAYYHCLFFGSIVLILKRRMAAAAIIVFLLALSHPYTGLELLAIVFVWSFTERFFTTNPTIPTWFAMICGVILLGHIVYYLIYLPQFESHRVIMTQWQQPWILRPETTLTAYAIVGLLSIWTLRRVSFIRSFFSGSTNRLLFVWFIVAFLLANHQYLIRAVQPIHFTRGYVWTALFFIGAPSLIILLEKMQSSRRVLSKVGMAAFLIAFLLDNATWLTAVAVSPSLVRDSRDRSDIVLTRNQKELLTWMDSEETLGAVVLSEDEKIGYLATVYTPLRSWYGHPFNTPQSSKRKEELNAFFSKGQVQDIWTDERLLLVFRKNSQYDSVSGAFRQSYYEGSDSGRLFENGEYRAIVLDKGGLR